MSFVPSLLPRFGVLMLLPFLTVLLDGASVIQLNRISFDKVGRDEWLRARVQISASANPFKEAKNSRFVDDVKVKLYLSFWRSKKWIQFLFQ